MRLGFFKSRGLLGILEKVHFFCDELQLSNTYQKLMLLIESHKKEAKIFKIFNEYLKSVQNFEN